MFWPTRIHQRLNAWVLDIAEVLGNFQHDPDRMAQIVQSLQQLKAYISAHIEQQRKQPNEGLIHALLTAVVDGQHLTDDEVVANTILILVGGNETSKTRAFARSRWASKAVKHPSLQSYPWDLQYEAQMDAS